MTMQHEPAAASTDGKKLGGGAIASLGGLSVLAIFMVQNRDDVTVTFLAWDFAWPVWLLVLAAAIFGAVVWLGLGIIRRSRRRRDRRAERRS